MEEKPKRRSKSVAAREGADFRKSAPTGSKADASKDLPFNPLSETADPRQTGSNATLPLGNPGYNQATAVSSPGSMEKTLPAQRLVTNRFEVAALSNVGKIRTNNEDSYGTFLGSVPRLNNDQELLFSFMAVADGMGGHENGEVASNIAIRKMTEGVLRNFYLPTLEGEQPGRTGDSPMETLASLIEDANQAILQQAQQDRISMGTTLTCMVRIGQTAVIGHVGDSRLYILDKSSPKLRQVTHDHSMVQRLVDLGTITREEALNNPQRSVLYLTLGQKGQVEPDVELVQLAEVASILICSDGLWEMLEESAIERILKQAYSAAEACEKLVEAANAAGGYDNITVIVAKF
ncbi:MAG: hypothetical protein JWP00_4728 [Chloroflexi bacterium]|jgi:protein phosphatase|nr:hypothetical protein [Chloroflexota bacterium]